MVKDTEKIHELHASGLGCAQVLVAMGLWKLGEENPRLVDAARGLCFGCFCDKICGALTGAFLMLAMFDPKQAADYMIPELASWFEYEFGKLDCPEILEHNPGNKPFTCPPIIEKTYLKAKELLQEVGYDL